MKGDARQTEAVLASKAVVGGKNFEIAGPADGGRTQCTPFQHLGHLFTPWSGGRTVARGHRRQTGRKSGQQANVRSTAMCCAVTAVVDTHALLLWTRARTRGL